MEAYLELVDGTKYHGQVFGHPAAAAGDLVFNTGMTGYPETFTDPSYTGQIVVLTYPLIGNYGVPAIGLHDNLSFGAESDRAHVRGVVVADYSAQFSHWEANQSLGTWLAEQQVVGLTGIDTRAVTKRLRDHGTLAARIVVNDCPPEFENPDATNLVARVSIDHPTEYPAGPKRVLLIDCGCKSNIIRSLLNRNVTVLRVPWDFDPRHESYDGILVSNGPGDPTVCQATIDHLRTAMNDQKPIFGICLGHQLMALAAGASTYKLKFGHRGQNQPCIEVGSHRCLITAKNHGYVVDETSIPADWESSYFNANDSTNAGIRHKHKPFFSVQFHPEAFPGPCDSGFLFDRFVELL